MPEIGILADQIILLDGYLLAIKYIEDYSREKLSLTY